MPTPFISVGGTQLIDVLSFRALHHLRCLSGAKHPEASKVQSSSDQNLNDIPTALDGGDLSSDVNCPRLIAVHSSEICQKTSLLSNFHRTPFGDVSCLTSFYLVQAFFAYVWANSG